MDFLSLLKGYSLEREEGEGTQKKPYIVICEKQKEYYLTFPCDGLYFQRGTEAKAVEFICCDVGVNNARRLIAE